MVSAAAPCEGISDLSGLVHHNIPVLRRPVELAQYTSFAFTSLLIEAGVDASVGSVGHVDHVQAHQDGGPPARPTGKA